jgi:hypothetical protein
LPGVFGTIDLILRSAKNVLHVDFKFGQGVPVSVTYPVPITRGLGGAVTVEEEKVNEQLMFYVVAARHNLRKLVYEKGDRLIVAIIQPRIEEAMSYTTVKDWELSDFEKRMQRAIVTALTPEAPRTKGEHCRWAPCKVTCPLWNDPLLDLAAFKFLKPGAEPSIPEDAYGKHLAHAKTLVDMAAVIKTEVDLQLHTYLANGGRVPGWRLKEKKKMRQWIDEKKVETALRKLGFKPSEIYRRKLLTFEAADALAKRKRVTIPDRLRVAPPSAETTIAQDSDPAPRVTPVIAIEQFRASLAALVGPNLALPIGPNATTLPKPETGSRRQQNDQP